MAVAVDNKVVTGASIKKFKDYVDQRLAVAAPLTLSSLMNARENLIDNPWFTVNQRGTGRNALGAGFWSDRWRTHSNYIYVTNSNAGGLTLVPSTTLSGAAWVIRQNIESNRLETGQKYTASMYVTLTNVNRCSLMVSFRDSSDTEISNTSKTLVNGNNTITFTMPSNGSSYVRLGIYYNGQSGSSNIGTSTTIVVKNAKIERGSDSTLAYDDKPIYATEMLRCHRYFNTFYHTVKGYGNAASAYYSMVHYPVQMAGTPSITIVSEPTKTNVREVSTFSLMKGARIQVTANNTGYMSYICNLQVSAEI